MLTTPLLHWLDVMGTSSTEGHVTKSALLRVLRHQIHVPANRKATKAHMGTRRVLEDAVQRNNSVPLASTHSR